MGEKEEELLRTVLTYFFNLSKFVFLFSSFHFSKHSSLFKIFVIKNCARVQFLLFFIIKLFFNICFNSCSSEYLRSILKMNIGISRSVSFLDLKSMRFTNIFLLIFSFFFLHVDNNK